MNYRDLPVDDAAEQAAVQQCAFLTCSQLSPGAYSGRVRELAVPSMRVVMEYQSQAVHKRAALAPGQCNVSFVREAQQAGRFSGHRLSTSSLYLLPGDLECDVRIGAHHETVYFSFDQASLMEDWSVLAGADLPRHPRQLVEFGGQDVAGLAGMVDRAFGAVSGEDRSAPPADTHRLLGGIRQAVLWGMQEGRTRAHAHDRERRIAPERRVRVLARACEYVNEAIRAGQDVSLVDVCRVAGVSQRTLQYCFLTLMQMTPVAYVRTIRLNGVRQALLRHDCQGVGEAACRYGFWHLSKFAGDYRRMFGERPSDTLRRGRAG